MRRSTLGMLMSIALLAVAMLFAAPGAAWAQNAVIRGSVRSDNGEPVVGANVYFAELSTQAATNETGRYVLTVPGDRVRGQQLQLRVRAIGYRPSSRSVTIAAGEQTADFTLAADVNRLDEIVVTGVMEGTEQTKVPFSVGHVDAADVPVPALDPLRMLAGRVPGAIIISNTGRPGVAPSIVLRGPTSFNGSGRGQGPLFIVDGVEIVGALPDINPSDIENVEVVKGASASSLYGARAGNGVIQITTRNGRRSADGMSFNARVEAGINDIEHTLALTPTTSLLMDSKNERFCQAVTGQPMCSRTFDWNTEAARVNNEPGDFALPPVPFQQDLTSSSPFSILPHMFQAHNWPGRVYDVVDQVVTNGRFLNTTLDMTGRFNQTNVFASASANNQAGSIRFLEGYQRYSGRLNVDQRLGEKWTLALRTYYARSKNDGADADNNAGSILGAGVFLPITRQRAIENLLARDTLGRLYVRTDIQSAGNANPMNALANETDIFSIDRFIAGFNTHYSPARWIDLEGNVGLDLQNQQEDAFRDKGFRVTASSATSLGAVGQNARRDQSINTSMNLTLRPNTGRDLNTRVSFRYLYEQQDIATRQGFGSQLSSVGIATLNNASTGISISSSKFSTRQIGYFAGIGLEYKNRYILDALVRRDGSSLFGAADRWQTFGRLSLAWRPTQESWWFAPSAINEMKLRYSRGTAGGRPRFEAQYETWSVSASGPSFGTLGNRNLRPEVTDETEIGADMELFHRIGLNLTYAASETRNQILPVPNPVDKGFGQQWKNVGTMTNRTWELALNIPVVTRRNLAWSWQFTFDRTRTRVKTLDVQPFTYGTAPQATDAIYYLQAGHPYAEFYGSQFVDNCSQLPDMSGIAGGRDFRAMCGPGQPFQQNDDGHIVWVGAGHTWQDGITRNLWGTGVVGLTTAATSSGCVHVATRASVSSCDRNSDGALTTADSVDVLSPWGVNLNWGALIPIRDTVCMRLPTAGCARFNMPLGTGLPEFQFSIGQNFQYKRFTVYGLLQSVVGRNVWDQGRQWAHLDFNVAHTNQRDKSVETAKPVGYYWRAASPDAAGYGGYYDFLNRNSLHVERASYAKLRELLVSYNVGPVAGVGNWTLSLLGRNLFTITSYKGYDPEVGQGGGDAGSGAISAVDAFTFPNTRQFTFALSTSF